MSPTIGADVTEDLKNRVDESREEGESRSAAVRRLLRQSLNEYDESESPEAAQSFETWFRTFSTVFLILPVFAFLLGRTVEAILLAELALLFIIGSNTGAAAQLAEFSQVFHQQIRDSGGLLGVLRRSFRALRVDDFETDPETPVERIAAATWFLPTVVAVSIPIYVLLFFVHPSSLQQPVTELGLLSWAAFGSLPVVVFLGSAYFILAARAFLLIGTGDSAGVTSSEEAT